MGDLESRIARLEAIQAIQQLKSLALFYADRKDAKGLADLFTEDGILIGAFQKHEGREMIEKNIQFWPFAVHYVMNPIIKLDGDRATGLWYWLRPQITHEGEAYWAAGWYDDVYARFDGEWKFKSVKIINFFYAPYAKGWTKGEVASLGQGVLGADVQTRHTRA
jgi:hypothetical protein